MTVAHGTTTRYCNYGCRCRPCRDAVAAYARKRWAGLSFKRRRAIARRGNYALGYLCESCGRGVSDNGAKAALSAGRPVGCRTCRGLSQRLEPTHGKEKTYNKHRCRCDECRSAASLARKGRLRRARA